MGGIFISYRRGDSEGQARALSLELANYIGDKAVFMDVDSIALGRDFRQSLHDSLESCEALLALIGPSWLDSKDAAGKRRLDDPSDFVRQEIATALKRNIPVTPVLLQRAQMPAEQSLPDDLKELAFRNGFELSHTRWRSDVREMVQKLGLGSAAAAPSESGLASPAKSIALDQPPAIRSATPPERQAEVSGMARARLWLTRRGALGASAAAAAAGAVAISAPYIRRWASSPPRPALKTIAFDYATVDEKGARMPSERARRRSSQRRWARASAWTWCRSRQASSPWARRNTNRSAGPTRVRNTP